MGKAKTYVFNRPAAMDDEHGMRPDGSVHPRTLYVRRGPADQGGEIQGVADKPVGTMSWLEVASAIDAVEIAEYQLVVIRKFKLSMEETNG